MKTNVELQIDELILHGLPSWQRDRIAAAVEAELQRLLDEGGLPPPLAGGGTLPQVQVDGLQLEAGAQSGAVGAQIAGSIYGRLAGNRPLPDLPEGSTK
jgi:hypothetical protein